MGKETASIEIKRDEISLDESLLDSRFKECWLFMLNDYKSMSFTWIPSDLISKTLATSPLIVELEFRRHF